MSFKCDILYFDVIGSTNDYLYDLVNNNVKSNKLVVAKKQTTGHGTNGRVFISNENGIYFSLLFFYEKEIIALTPKIAVSIYKVLLYCYGIKLEKMKIKLLGFYVKD